MFCSPREAFKLHSVAVCFAGVRGRLIDFEIKRNRPAAAVASSSHAFARRRCRAPLAARCCLEGREARNCYSVFFAGALRPRVNACRPAVVAASRSPLAPCGRGQVSFASCARRQLFVLVCGRLGKAEEGRGKTTKPWGLLLGFSRG